MSDFGSLLQGRLVSMGFCPVLVVGFLFALLALAGPVASAEAAPNISIEKTAGSQDWPGSEIEAGDSAIFTITVTNNGSVPTDVTLDDPLPGGTGLFWGIWNSDPWTAQDSCIIDDAEGGQSLSCSFTDIPAGGSISLEVGAWTGLGRCATWTNTATASSTDQSGTTTVSDSATVTCIGPDLTLTKTPGQTTVVAGQDISFTIVLANAGPGTLYDWQVWLEDQLPGGTAGPWVITDGPSSEGEPLCDIYDGESGQEVYCNNLGQLNPGASVSITVKAPTSTEFCSTYNNTVTAREGGLGRSAARGADQGGSELFARDDGLFELTADATAGCRQPAPGLELTKTAVKEKVKAGEDVAFTIVASSTGDIPAENVKLSDPLPSGTAGPWKITDQPAGTPCAIAAGTLSCQFGSISNGDSRSVKVSSPTSKSKCGRYENTATASADGVPGVTAAAVVSCKVPAPNPRPQLKKKADRKVVRPGQKVHYRVMVRNSRIGSTAKNLKICDRIPAGMSVVKHPGSRFVKGQLCWQVKKLKGSQQWKTFRYTTRVNSDARKGAKLKNVVTLGNLRAHWTVNVAAAMSRRGQHTPVTG